MQFFAVCKVTQKFDLEGNPVGDPYNQVEQDNLREAETANIILGLYQASEPTATFVVEEYSVV
jgi:hypothetical protein